MAHFSSYGGGVDQTAVIGHPPEDRTWTKGMEMWEPEIGQGARIEAFVSVDAGLKRPTHIGARSWLMKHVHIGHDAWVGQDCELAPGTVVGGHVQIADAVKVGVNATILPGVRVGEGARIGAGAVVTKNVPAGEVWVGNPARRLEDRPPHVSRESRA
jgi:acetyltransferase-like isoleucine patch superfamily enzyme